MVFCACASVVDEQGRPVEGEDRARCARLWLISLMVWWWRWLISTGGLLKKRHQVDPERVLLAFPLRLCNPAIPASLVTRLRQVRRCCAYLPVVYVNAEALSETFQCVFEALFLSVHLRLPSTIHCRTVFWKGIRTRWPAHLTWAFIRVWMLGRSFRERTLVSATLSCQVLFSSFPRKFMWKRFSCRAWHYSLSMSHIMMLTSSSL